MDRVQLLLTLYPLLLISVSASPAPTRYRRDMSSGAKAGFGVGIAVAVILVILIITFFAIHLRRRARITALNNERAILAGEKNPDGTEKFDKFAPQPEVSRPGVRRNKSVKDRLMGPLYRGSMIEMPHMPPKARFAGAGAGDRTSRMSTMTTNEDGEWIHKPFANNSPRPSFSSKRATRMMMMM